MSLNLAMILRESAQRHPQNPALTFEGNTLNYSTLDLRARTFAGLLRDLGLRPGQHVALLLPDTPVFSFCYFGALYAGNPVVPLHPQLTLDELTWHLEDSDAVALIAWGANSSVAQRACAAVSACQTVLISNEHGSLPISETKASLQAQMERCTPISYLHPTSPEETAVLLYTSGTTGRAKACELSHANLFFAAETNRGHILPIGPQTVAMACLPLHHAFGQLLHNALVSAGGHLVLAGAFDPYILLGLIQQYGIQVLAAVPTMWLSVLYEPRLEEIDVSSLTYCITGGAAMPADKLLEVEERLGVQLLEGYGTSEICATGAFNGLDDERRPGSIGRPTWGLEFRLVDENLTPITTPNAPGELLVSGPTVMKGYYKRPALNELALVDGWFRTGDIAQVDSEGYWRIVGRRKNMINRGGQPVFPLEIERVLCEHPDIAAAAVRGVTDSLLGEDVQALIVLKPTAHVAVSSLHQHCRERLAPYKRPRDILIVPHLDYGPTGKLISQGHASPEDTNRPAN